MRVERILPEKGRLDGSAASNHSLREREKLLEPFMTPIKEQGKKVMEPFMTPISRAAQEAGAEQNKPYLLAKLEEKVSQLNETVEIFDKRIHFRIHDDTNRIMVQVIEKATDEVISEIPPEKVLDMVARIEEMIGLIVDKLV